MALITRLTNWSAGDKLLATPFEAEWDNIIDVLSGASQKNVKIVYNSSDIANVEATSSAAGQEAFLATLTGAGAKGFVVNDGTSDTFYVDKDGNITGEEATIGGYATIGGDATVAGTLGVTGTTTVGRIDVDQAKATVQSLTDATTIAWDASAGHVATVTLEDNRTLGAPSNLLAGSTLVLAVTQDGTGSRTLAYNAVFQWQFGTAPTLTTTAGATDVLTFYCIDGTNLIGSIVYDVS